jgi:hypothetical protein
MSSRHLSRLAVAGLTLAAGLAVAIPAHASVTYDPETKTGFVGASDLRKAFGWTGAKLTARAPAIVFDHDFWTDDTYAVTCGKVTVRAVHHRDFGRFELSGTFTGAAPGYGGGFRLTGPHLGISGTSVPPMPGQPCPDRPGAEIDRVHLSGTTVGWALTVRYRQARHRLLVHETGDARG